MPASRKCSEELGEGVVRVCLDALKDSERAKACFKQICDSRGISGETLRGCVRHAQKDARERPTTTTADAERIRRLETENHELRRANAISESASAFFVAELDHPQR